MPTSSSKCKDCLHDGRNCVFEGPTADQREKQRLRVKGKRCRRVADSSSEESDSSSYFEDEEEEENHFETSHSDRFSMRQSDSITMDKRRVGLPPGAASEPTIVQLVTGFQKRLDAGESGKVQASSIPPGQPGFAEQIVRALSPERTPPTPKRRKKSTRRSWDSHPTPSNSQAHSVPPPPSPSPGLEVSAQRKRQKTMLRVYLVGESKHKMLSLGNCSWAGSLFSEIINRWAITERDVKKLCFTFTWKPQGDPTRTLELEDDFNIIGVDYLFEMIKDAPCWSETGENLTGMCLIDVDIFAF